MPAIIRIECPQCHKVAHTLDEMEELFGTRHMSATNEILPQSWCRECRKASSKVNTETK